MNHRDFAQRAENMITSAHRHWGTGPEGGGTVATCGVALALLAIYELLDERLVAPGPGDVETIEEAL